MSPLRDAWLAFWRWISGAERRAAERQAYLDALQAVVEVVRAQSEASAALSEATRAWLELFRTPEKPTTWANSELTEAIQEAKRLEELKKQGFPVELTGFEQAAWVAQGADQVDELFKRAYHG